MPGKKKKYNARFPPVSFITYTIKLYKPNTHWFYNKTQCNLVISYMIDRYELFLPLKKNIRLLFWLGLLHGFAQLKPGFNQPCNI